MRSLDIKIGEHRQMVMRVVCTQPISQRARDILAPVAKLTINEGVEPWTRNEILEKGRTADALLVFMSDTVDTALLKSCPNLRVVAGALKGGDHIDVDACTRRNVWVTVVDDLLTEPTAELAVGLVLALDRHLVDGDQHVRQGFHEGWRPQFYGRGLARRKAGIVGFGPLGRAIGHRLRAMNMQIFYSDLSSQEDVDWATRVETDRLVSSSDVIVMAAPFVPGSRPIVGAKELDTIQPGALIVNIGRGSTVDEREIARALTAGKLRGYAADVFAFEDGIQGDAVGGVPIELLQLSDRTVFTPHLGSAVVSAREAIEAAAAESIVAALQGIKPPGALNSVSTLLDSPISEEHHSAKPSDPSRNAAGSDMEPHDEQGAQSHAM